MFFIRNEKRNQIHLLTTNKTIYIHEKYVGEGTRKKVFMIAISDIVDGAQCGFLEQFETRKQAEERIRAIAQNMLDTGALSLSP